MSMSRLLTGCMFGSCHHPYIQFMVYGQTYNAGFLRFSYKSLFGLRLCRFKEKNYITTFITKDAGPH